MRIIYYSITGQTRRLLTKLNSDNYTDSLEIIADDVLEEQTEPFVLIVPSYAEEHNGIKKSQEIMDPVFEFMEYEGNYKHCSGIIGTGNKNFADLFGYTAIELEAKYNIPILYLAEFSGMPHDIEEINALLKTLSDKERN